MIPWLKDWQSSVKGVRRKNCVTLTLRCEAHRVWRRFACTAIEQFVQVGLVAECDPCQNDAGERYKLNDKSKCGIAGDGRVKIHPKSGGGDEVDNSNTIAQIFVTHNFLLKYDFLSIRSNVAVHCVGIVNKSVRNCRWFLQKCARKH